MRKKLLVLLVILLFVALCINVFGQTKSYPFEYVKSGQGKHTLILIPGFSCSGDVWTATRQKFEKDFTCYTLTMAGFAGSKAQPDPTFKNWESGIIAFIKDQHLEKPVIIGHSMGGGLALAIAADHPELVERIVVVDALPCLSALMNPTFKSAEKPDCSQLTSKVAGQSNEQFYQMQKASMAQLIADTTKHRQAIGWSMKSDRKTFAEMYCDFSNTDLRESIRTIQCPSLVLLEAPFKNLKQPIEEQYKSLKNADLRYANQGLHFIMYDDSDWYMTQLTSFVQPK